MSFFLPISPNFSFPKQELKILKFWKKISAFKQSLDSRKTVNNLNNYTFYDGPPFATGLPHYGHFVASVLKDVIPRYWTMRGKYVERRFGWDTHGLPIEMETEKKLKLSGPASIKKYGIAKFNEECRSSVLKYADEWEKIITRLGRWVDFKNDYKTMDPWFMESVWWVFSKLWEKELIYKDFRVMPYSWRLATPLSNFEANLDYRKVSDPAITVKFLLLDNEKFKNETYLLVWTTTPWTLPSNFAIAINKDIEYVEIALNEDASHYIVAKERMNEVFRKEVKIVRILQGKEILGLQYKPLFDNYLNLNIQEVLLGKLFRILDSNTVSSNEGTGLVHIAPAFGQEDFDICKKNDIPPLGNNFVDEEGVLTDLGVNFKEADKILIHNLKKRGLLFRHDTIQHNYPFCWRSGTPLIYKTIPSWFIRVEHFRKKLIDNNKKINWVPTAVGEKRFENWLREAQDWCISRNRFWGTPIPLWICKNCKNITCINSISDLETKSHSKIVDIHPHLIDELSIKCEKCSGEASRIPEVFDCWFESGSVPYAQNHYPFENSKTFKNKFPADYIAEGLDQTRAWFYTLLVLSTILFDEPPFKNVIVNGLVLASDGSKMSKSKKNYPNPSLIIEQYGSDALRVYLLNSPVIYAEPLLFQESGVREIVRVFMLPLLNAWSFFVQYANIDDWRPTLEIRNKIKEENLSEIDKWILSRLESLILEINICMEKYHLHKAVPLMLTFIDDLTNWYIRCNRRRFWSNTDKSKFSSEKDSAYWTLYKVLVTFAKIIAPISPFIAETIYQNLVANFKESIHCCDYPIANIQRINKLLEQEMLIVRQIVALGRILREKCKIKTRQPLLKITVIDESDNQSAIVKFSKLIKQELNIKDIEIGKDDHSVYNLIFDANYKKLGKRVGNKMKTIAQAIQKFSYIDFEYLKSGNSILLFDVNIFLEDVIFTRKPKTDIVLESKGSMTVILDTYIDQDLLMEGLMREVISKLQKLRKDLGLDITDRIDIMFDSSSETLLQAIKLYENTIKEEVLAINFINSNIKTGDLIEIDHFILRIKIQKNQIATIGLN